MKTLLEVPKNAHACYVMAHGAGAGMTHPFLASVAKELAGRGIATLRYNFPYMDRGSKRPDTPKVAQAAVREAVTIAAPRPFPWRLRMTTYSSFGDWASAAIGASRSSRSRRRIVAIYGTFFRSCCGG